MTTSSGPSGADSGSGYFGDSTLLFRLLIGAILALFSALLPISPDQARWGPLVAIGVYISASFEMLDHKVRTRTEDLRTAARELLLINDLIQSSFEVAAVDDFWPILSFKLKAFFSCERVTVFLRNQNGSLRSVYADGLESPLVLDEGKGVAGLVAGKKRAYFTNEPYKDPNFQDLVDKETGFTTRSVMCGPLVRDGEVTGVAGLLNKEGGFADIDAVMLTRLGPQIQIVFDKLRSGRERALLGDALRESDKHAAMGRLMAGLAHEIRNPLATVLGNTQLLIQDHGESKDRDEVAAAVAACLRAEAF